MLSKPLQFSTQLYVQNRKRMGTFFICYTGSYSVFISIESCGLRQNKHDRKYTYHTKPPPPLPRHHAWPFSPTSFITHHSHLTALTRSCGFSLAWICFPGNKTQCLPTQCYSAFFAQNFQAFRDFNLFLPCRFHWNVQLNWITRIYFGVLKGWTLGINFQLDRQVESKITQLVRISHTFALHATVL